MKRSKRIPLSAMAFVLLVPCLSAKAHDWHRHEDPVFRDLPHAAPPGQGAASAPLEPAPSAITAAELITQTFAPFSPRVKVRVDGSYAYVESDGIPNHRSMVGITAWQQQVPLPQPFQGTNAFRLPLAPVLVANPVPFSGTPLRNAIAVAANGIPIFPALNNRGEDSLLIGELDEWNGHCGLADDYHYHAAPLHLAEIVGKGLPIGFGFDGLPIYGLTEPDGTPVTGLDALHGHLWSDGTYHYHASAQYPYTLGGFRGQVSISNGEVSPQPRTRSPRPGQPPLSGATIVASSYDVRAGTPDAFELTYRRANQLYKVRYRADRATGTVVYEYEDPSGAIRTERYTNWSAPTVPQYPSRTLFVPAVLSAPGANGSSYSSELTLVNRGARDATVTFTYTPAGGQPGVVTIPEALPAGVQRVIPDVIAHLRELGAGLAAGEAQVGTLAVAFADLSSTADGAAMVRTTTATGAGRAGLAYAAIDRTATLSGPSYLYGLRQNDVDRTNIAVQHAGEAGSGPVTLRLTVFPGNGGLASGRGVVLPDVTLAPGEFRQIDQVLVSNGLSLSSGIARVERVAGTAFYGAYAVVNDQVTSDGSLLPAVPESGLIGRARLVVPVMVESAGYSSELVIANLGSSARSLRCRFVAEAVATANHSASFDITLLPGEQRIVPEIVSWMRSNRVEGIGPAGPTFAGALFVEPATGTLDGIAMAARTATAGPSGHFGVFASATASSETPVTTSWLYGLRQDSENRSNLALVNTGLYDASPSKFRLEIFDGQTGTRAYSGEPVTLDAARWTQLDALLSTFAPGVSQGYARVTRTTGNNGFLLYGVINDGAHPGERTGDGSLLPGTP